MMYGETITNYPEAFGVELVANLRDPEACYGFDDVRVWRVLADGSLRWGQDSGCSCPTPFEDVRGLDGLSVLDDFHKFMDEVNDCWCTFSRSPKRQLALTEFFAEVRQLIS